MTLGVGKKTVEYVIYLLFWGLLLFAPYIGDVIIKQTHEADIKEMYSYWIFLLPAAIVFIINNNVLMPFLLYNKKRGRYYLFYVICIIVTCCIVFLISPIVDYTQGPPDKRPPGSFMHEPPKRKPAGPFFPEDFFFEEMHEDMPDMGHAMKPFHPQKRDSKFLLAMSNPGTMRVLMVVFVVFFNICVRLSFFALRRDERFKELEREKLKAELNYLKYQINPHFFMNTLNNIHALVDIDAEKAQHAILELSKMMRYVLYDASSSFVPLEKEIAFLNSYIDLMRLRYTDKLEVKTSFPTGYKSVNIPSLLLVVFIENAFKHGVTYTRQSSIDIDMRVDDVNGLLVFKCSNTFVRKSNPSRQNTACGIGVENACKRLALLYETAVVLDIEDDGNNYSVILKIPYKDDKVYNC